MGILRLNKILSKYALPCSAEEVSEASRFKAVDVCFDGSLFVFNGCVESSLVHRNGVKTNVYDESMIADTAFQVLQTHVQTAKSKFHVNKFKFYIDGVKPTLKRHTMQKRRKLITFSPAKAMNMLCDRICKQLPDMEIVNLLLGESEHEFFLHRDCTRPNLLITDDTDLFHISYKYKKRTKNDTVYLCKKNFSKIYDMSQFNCNMPRLLFSLVLFMKGSDFTDALITDTMCDAIFNIYNNLNKTSKYLHRYKAAIKDVCNKYADREKEIQTQSASGSLLSLNQPHNYSDDDDDPDLNAVPALYEVDDVRTIISYLLLMLLYVQKVEYVKFSWNNKAGASPDPHRTDAYLASLTWSVNYSLIGARYSHYDETGVTYCEIHPLNFYLDVLTTNKEFHTVLFRRSLIDLKTFREVCRPTADRFYGS